MLLAFLYFGRITVDEVILMRSVSVEHITLGLCDPERRTATMLILTQSDSLLASNKNSRDSVRQIDLDVLNSQLPDKIKVDRLFVVLLCGNKCSVSGRFV